MIGELRDAETIDTALKAAETGHLLMSTLHTPDASSTIMRMLAMFPPFVAVLVSKGAPTGLAVYAFACFANLAAGLTNYGTTPSPMFFAQGYVSLKRWWLVGLIASVVNLAVWSTIGFAWWKLIGIW